jgi:hypothetical protein
MVGAFIKINGSFFYRIKFFEGIADNFCKGSIIGSRDSSYLHIFCFLQTAIKLAIKYLAEVGVIFCVWGKALFSM